jgi:replication-associated recombination protein RarA
MAKLTKREKQKKEILQLLSRKQNVFLIGQGGIGKTKLLKDIAAELGPEAYYLESLAPAKSTLKAAYAELGDYHADDLKQMKVSSWTVPQLVKAIISELEGQDFVLILDHLDRITVASSEWLRELAESDVTILAAARETKEHKELLDRFFWTTQTVTLQPLSDGELSDIVRECVNDPAAPLEFRDAEAERFFVKTVLNHAKGIPLVAVQMCKKAAGVKSVSMTFVREHLMTPHSASVKYDDLTPLVLIPIALVGALRYLGRGMGNVELYVLAGSLMAAAVVIRLLMPRRTGQRKAS